MPRPRDYKAEYRRRIARGLAKGQSRKEARGHSPRTRMGAPKSEAWDPRERILEKGLKQVKSGVSLAKAAKELHVAPERLQRYIAVSGIASKRHGRWRIGPDDRTRTMPLYSQGRELTVKVDIDNASLVGGYLSAVGKFLDSNETWFLTAWEDVVIVDTRGRRHLVEARPNVLYRLAASGTSSFEQIYRINL